MTEAEERIFEDEWEKEAMFALGLYLYCESNPKVSEAFRNKAKQAYLSKVEEARQMCNIDI